MRSALSLAALPLFIYSQQLSLFLSAVIKRKRKTYSRTEAILDKKVSDTSHRLDNNDSVKISKLLWLLYRLTVTGY